MGSFFSEKIVLEEMIQDVIAENNSLAKARSIDEREKQEIRKAYLKHPG